MVRCADAADRQRLDGTASQCAEVLNRQNRIRLREHIRRRVAADLSDRLLRCLRIVGAALHQKCDLTVDRFVLERVRRCLQGCQIVVLAPERKEAGALKRLGDVHACLRKTLCARHGMHRRQLRDDIRAIAQRRGCPFKFGANGDLAALAKAARHDRQHRLVRQALGGFYYILVSVVKRIELANDGYHGFSVNDFMKNEKNT